MNVDSVITKVLVIARKVGEYKMENQKPIFKCRECGCNIPSTLNEGRIEAMRYCPSCGKEGTAERIIVENIADSRVVLND